MDPKEVIPDLVTKMTKGGGSMSTDVKDGCVEGDTNGLHLSRPAGGTGSRRRRSSA